MFRHASNVGWNCWRRLRNSFPRLSSRMPIPLDLYVIPTTRGQHTLFSTPDSLMALEAESTDRVRQFIEWFTRRSNRLVAWIGRGVRSLHVYYARLEDKIDPMERVLKAMASTNRFVVYTRASGHFQRVVSLYIIEHEAK